MKDIYLLSGLGADKRVFESLDLSRYSVHHIEWIPPHKNESIEYYAGRLLNQIPTTNPILIGVSFGGMVAQEIARQKEVAMIIQISSSKTRADLPWIYRAAGRLGIIHLVPSRLLKSMNLLTANWFFGTTSEHERVLLKRIILETDDTFLKWAIRQITNWKNESSNQNTITIHGNRDRILPIRKCDYEINGGGHLMILNRAKEISAILQKIIG